MDFTKALFDRLTGDSTLGALLAEYAGGPAVFAEVPPPDFALDAKPCAVLSVAANGDRDDFGQFIREAECDVRLYAKAGLSLAGIEAAAERIRSLLHRETLAIAGASGAACRVSGPVSAPTSGPDIIGRRLAVSILAPEV